MAVATALLKLISKLGPLSAGLIGVTVISLGVSLRGGGDTPSQSYADIAAAALRQDRSSGLAKWSSFHPAPVQQSTVPTDYAMPAALAFAGLTSWGGANLPVAEGEATARLRPAPRGDIVQWPIGVGPGFGAGAPAEARAAAADSPQVPRNVPAAEIPPAATGDTPAASQDNRYSPGPSLAGVMPISVPPAPASNPPTTPPIYLLPSGIDVPPLALLAPTAPPGWILPPPIVVAPDPCLDPSTGLPLVDSATGLPIDGCGSSGGAPVPVPGGTAVPEPSSLLPFAALALLLAVRRRRTGPLAS